ncbi:MAG TPA: hypothetical protein VMM36_09790 [Opitutaceae bacterium]|nr:hypothetical protein [Opitutaceae bacterium]
MKSFLTGKKTIEMPSPETGPIKRPNPAWMCRREFADPTIEVIKEGDKIIRIVVTCSCGERTEVECLYPAG